MIKLNIPSFNINQLLLITSAYFTCVLNYPFLSNFIKAILALDKFELFFLISVPVLLCALMVILLCVFSFKYIIKPLLVVLLLVSSLIFYSSIHYGVVFDYGMIENSIETSSAEAFTYFNTEIVLYFLVFGVVPACFVSICKVTYQPLIGEIISRLKLVLLAMIAFFIIAFFYYQDYASVGRNNKHLKKFIVPSQFLSSGYKYLKYNYFDEELNFITLDKSPIDRQPNNKEVIVFVVGETARAKNFSANGYEKPTNSHTQQFQVTSFKNMHACGTATAVSVPCMFSSFTRENFNRRKADHQQNLLDVIALAGVDVLWVDNNGCKDVCNRIATIKIDVKQDSPLCDGQYCQDEMLLVPLKQKLAHLSENKTVIVLHMMGSHGPTYFKRYPSQHKKFIPDCERGDIQNCSAEQLTNTYDNTIAYTDYVLSQIISELASLPEDINKSMLYISDHGESLGESGAYLHGFPYAFAPKEQRHIPMLVWMSKQDKQQKISQNCLSELADNERFSHDNVYHSMLGLLDINSSTYQKKLDIFSQCSDSLSGPQIRIAQTKTGKNE